MEKIKQLLKSIPRARCVALVNGYQTTVYYHGITPQADNAVLAMLCNRVVLFHGSATKPDLQIILAGKDVLQAGWVIGVVNF